MKKYINLIIAEIKRDFIMIKCYPANFIGDVMSFVVISMLIIFGINKIGEKIQVVAMIAFPILLSLIGLPASSIREDIELGTFEQIYNGAFTLRQIIICRSFSSLIISFIPTVIIYFMVEIFFIKLNISFPIIFIVIILLILNGISVGFLFGSIALLYKRIDSLLNFFYILLAVELLVPFINLDGMIRVAINTFVPLAGVISVMQILVNPLNISESINIILLAILNTVLWTCISFFIYNYALKRAKIRGTLGMY